MTTDYTYDAINRLRTSTANDGYNTAYTYDLNSSPKAIQRHGLVSVYRSTELVYITVERPA